MKTITTTDLQIHVFEIKKATLLFRTVNNNMRNLILHLLHKNQMLTVTSIYKALKIEQSVASQHPEILRKANFVLIKRDGKRIYYSANYKRFAELNDYAEQLLLK